MDSSPAPAAEKKQWPYRGVRMRKWGKWVAEIREPNKRSRIWLGSYASPVAAARAYDTAVFYLRGRSAFLNFPDDIPVSSDAPAAVGDLSAALVRKRAAEVGAAVDALLLQKNKKRNMRPDLNCKPSSDETYAAD
ncbi:Ethylene-responsive transcription factor ERF011 [Platanthera guangdongensis]|uniref:Ethylene-responsive transcription factor ERF011 n=1 Tax=Platanthera guangdongensis TaxID=2320717 RepID=A0ABR2LE78_9ASPA